MKIMMQSALVFGFSFLSLMNGVSSFAQTDVGAGAVAASPTPFHVNPESIRHQLLEQNLSLEASFKLVQDAKDSVSGARANLLPSVQLSGLLNPYNISSFILSGVDFLLPFLLPSNWFNLKEEKNQFNAEKIGYRVLELNTYSSALSIYYTALSDQETAKIYEQEAADYQSIEQSLNDQDHVFHNVSSDQINQAIAQAAMAKSQADGLDALASQELASLRTALNLPIEMGTLILDSDRVKETPLESTPLATAITQAEAIAPELEQIKFLVNGAQDARRSTMWSFLGAATLGAAVGSASGTAPVASAARVSGSMSIGAAIFPSVKVAARKVEEVQLQGKEVRQQITQVLEATLNSFAKVKDQLASTVLAESKLKDVYDSLDFQYRKLNTATFTDVLVARTEMVAASVAKVQAELSLNLLRVTLNRTLLADQFAFIKGCSMVSTKKKQTLYEACREAGAANLPSDMSAGMTPD